MATISNIEGMSETEFAQFFNAALTAIKENPLDNFFRANAFLDFSPTPAQTVILKVALGQPLDPVIKFKVNFEDMTSPAEFALNKREMTEIELYEFMTEESYVWPYPKKTRIDLICGRRAGKSTIISAMAVFFAIITNYMPYLKKHPYATVLVLSHSKEFSEEILDLIRSYIYGSDILTRLLNTDKQSKARQTIFSLKVPFIDEHGTLTYSRVVIRVGAASKKTVRGKAVCVLICDEIAHWNLQEGAADKDEDIIRAVRPALAQFKDVGYLFKLSSPSIKHGILYNEYIKSRKKQLPKDYVVFKAPTWLLNTWLTLEHYAAEYNLDPHGFMSEYRAEFVDAISNFCHPESVDACIIKGVPENAPEARATEVYYEAAIDAAFKNDRFTFTIVGYVRGKIKQYVLRKWEGTNKQPVKIFEVTEEIRQECLRFDITKVYADQYAFQPLKEIFEKYDLTLEEKAFTSTFKKQIYFNFKKLINNKQIDLLDDAIMIGEIKSLQVEQGATGVIRIGHPPGGHDDCASALAVASFIASDSINVVIDENEVRDLPNQNEYGIKIDMKTGRALQAPSPNMLTEHLGEVIDNSSEYVYDKEKKEYRKIEDGDEDEDDDDEGIHFLF